MAAQDLESNNNYLNASDIDKSLKTNVLNLLIVLIKQTLLDDFLESVLQECGIIY